MGNKSLREKPTILLGQTKIHLIVLGSILMLVDGVKKGVGTSLCNGQAPESQGLYLTYSFPMHPFSTPWKHMKTLQFSDIFRGYRKGAYGMNGLNGGSFLVVTHHDWNHDCIFVTVISMMHFRLSKM